MKSFVSRPSAQQFEANTVWTTETGWFARLRAWLFGYDIFISYKRKDGLGYAVAIEEQLRSRDLACFRDYSELPPGIEFDRHIKRALGRSRLLVAVGSPLAADSIEGEWVKREIETFLKKRTDVIVINIDGSIDDNTWPETKGMVRLDESREGLVESAPKQEVVEGINHSINFVRRNLLARWLMGLMITLIGIFASGSTWFFIELQEQLKVTSSNEMAFRALALKEQRPALLDESLQLAIDAAKSGETAVQDNALREILRIMPRLLADMPLACSTHLAAIDPGRQWLAVGQYGKICAIDLDSRKLSKVIDIRVGVDGFPGYSIKHLVSSPSGDWIAIALHKIGSQSVIAIYSAHGWHRLSSMLLAGSPSAIAISPRNDYLIVGTMSGELLRLALTPEGKIGSPTPLVAGGMNGLVHSLVFDSEGSRLAVFTKGKSIEIFENWNTDGPSASWSIQLSEDSIPNTRKAPMLFEPSGKYFIAAYDDHIEVRRLNDYGLAQVMPMVDVDALAMVEGERLAAHSKFDLFRLWGPRKPLIPMDVSKLSPFVPEVTANLNGGLTISGQLATSAAGNSILAVYRQEGATESWGSWIDVATGVEIGRVFHDKRIWHFFTVGEGMAGITVGADRKVRFWGNVNTRINMTEKGNTVDTVALSENLEFAAVSVAPILPFRTALEIWNIREFERLASIEGSGKVLALRFDEPGLNQLLVAGDDTLRVWENWRRSNARPEEVARFPVLTRGCLRQASFAGEKNLFATSSGRGKVWIYSKDRFFQLDMPGLRKKCVEALSLSPRGRFLAISYLGKILVVDIDLGVIVGEIATDYLVREVVFDAKESMLAFMSAEPSPDNSRNSEALVEIWSIVDPVRPRRYRKRLPSGLVRLVRQNLDAEGSHYKICIGPRGTILATQVTNTIRVWKLSGDGAVSLVPRATLQLSTGNVRRCRIAADDSRIVVVTDNGVEVHELSLEGMITEALNRLPSTDRK